MNLIGLDNNPKTLLWGLKYLVIISLSAVFCGFGFLVFHSAYQMKDPFHFLMVFFSACLIILVSASLFLGMMIRMWTFLKTDELKQD